MGKMSTQPRLVAALICGNEEERIERCVLSLQKIRQHELALMALIIFVLTVPLVLFPT